MKNTYTELINIAVSAYTYEHIISYTEDVRKNGLNEHGYPRLTANIGFLLSKGLRSDLSEIFPDMMELTCSGFQTALKKSIDSGHILGIGNDFSVKEIVLMLVELEKSGIYPKSLTAHWRDMLSSLIPYETYNCIASVPPIRIGNWAAFSAASEQVRIWAGLGNEKAFVENQIQSQLLSFDENGMYRDPHEPMVYDMVTRLQLAVALQCGYDGPGRNELVRNMKLSALPTLLMQSVTGEIPFGGRSNQFLHNDTFYAALCEFYASMYKNDGDEELAGQFKSAAHLACDGLKQWLKGEIHHIKNRFPLESKIGCEGYGYFDKYMVTMGSWAYLGYFFADDTIEEIPCPAMRSSHTYLTSRHFHKLFLQAGGYTAQIELNADSNYDAGGLGRLHKNGIPSSLCLSVPFAKNPDYILPAPNPSPLSITPCIYENRTVQIPEYWETDSYSSNGDTADANLHSFIGDNQLYMHVSLSERGAEIESNCRIAVPVFLSDGEEYTEIVKSVNSITAVYHGCSVSYHADNFTDTGSDYINRNGKYRLFIADGTLSICMSSCES